MFRPSPAPSQIARARWLLIGAFGANGVMVFSWLARIPAVRAGLGVSTAELGLILLIGSIGAVVTVIGSGVLMNRFGSRRLFTAGTLITAAGFLLMGLGGAQGSLAAFLAGLVINGLGGSLLSVPMNVEAARVERAVGRTIIPHFHASFSAGAALGSLLGAACSSLAIPVSIQFAVVAVLTSAYRLGALAGGLILPGAATPAPARTASSRQAMLAWREPRTLLIALVALAAALAEGAANNWLAVATVDGFAQSEAVGAIMLGAFIAAMTLMRVAGTGLVDRFGPVASVRASLAVSMAGLALFALAPAFPLAVAGVIAWGLGVAVVFPIAVSAASDDAQAAPPRVAVIMSAGTVAAVAAPPALGFVAAGMGTRQALLLVLAVLFAGVVVAPRLARTTADDARRTPLLPAVEPPAAVVA